MGQIYSAAGAEPAMLDDVGGLKDFKGSPKLQKLGGNCDHERIWDSIIQKSVHDAGTKGNILSEATCHLSNQW